MANTEVKSITWQQALTATPHKINLICSQQVAAFQEAVTGVLTTLLWAEEQVHGAQIVAKWPGFEDPSSHVGTLTEVSNGNAVFEDRIAVPLHLIIAVTI